MKPVKAVFCLSGKSAAPEDEIAIVDSAAGSYTLSIRFSETQSTVSLTLGESPTAVVQP